MPIKQITYKKLWISYIVQCMFIIILLYVIFYWFFIRPNFFLHEYQDKQWITDLTKNIVLGVKDPSKFANIQREYYFLSFWYTYMHFHTEKYTIWVLFNLQNKFSNIIVLNVYLYDFQNDAIIKDQIELNFNNLQTFETEMGSLVIQLGDSYYQEIDFHLNKSTLKITTNKIHFVVEMKIDDYTTNQASFLPRYQLLNNVVSVQGNETGSPGDWMSDNPFIGKIQGGSLNYDKIESGGNFWFDNFIGCNNNFLGSYIWFVIINDDWLIYLLWFDTYDVRNNIGTTKPILIKDRKRNKFLYSGTVGVECKKTPWPINSFNYSLEPATMTYESKKPIGSLDYDDYTVSFNSSKINIQIESIRGKCHKVFDYDYYKNDVTDSMRAGADMKEWDKKYYDVLSNIRYVEYVTTVNVKINYENSISSFEARQVIDAMYPINKFVPKKIQYNK